MNARIKWTVVFALSITLTSNLFAQQTDSPARIFTDQISYVAEPAARLARCGRMDFSEHLIDTYVELFASQLAIPPALLRHHLFKLSYHEYDRLYRTGWPDPRSASLECAAHARRALELIARWNLR